MAEKDEKKGSMSVKEAGHKGGEKTAKTHGHEFYEEIGHKGGAKGGEKGGQKVKDLIEKGKEAEEK
jgi:general stress protein YciG